MSTIPRVLEDNTVVVPSDTTARTLILKLVGNNQQVTVYVNEAKWGTVQMSNLLVTGAANEFGISVMPGDRIRLDGAFIFGASMSEQLVVSPIQGYTVVSSNIFGKITSIQIESVDSVQLTGTVPALQLGAGYSAANLDLTNFTLPANQVGSGYSAADVAGVLPANQVGSGYSATSLDLTNFTLPASQVGSGYSAADVTGVLPADQVGSGYAATSLDLTNFTLPASQVGSGYSAAGITGTLPASQVGAGYPAGDISGLPSYGAGQGITLQNDTFSIDNVAGGGFAYSGNAIYVLTDNSTIEISNGYLTIKSVPSSLISGTIPSSQISGNIPASQVSGTLPASQVGSGYSSYIIDWSVYATATMPPYSTSISNYANSGNFQTRTGRIMTMTMGVGPIQTNTYRLKLYDSNGTEYFATMQFYGTANFTVNGTNEMWFSIYENLPIASNLHWLVYNSGTAEIWVWPL